MVELERVVSAMRKVVERLQAENNSLKKSLKMRKNGHMDKTATGLEEENTKLKVNPPPPPLTLVDTMYIATHHISAAIE